MIFAAITFVMLFATALGVFFFGRIWLRESKGTSRTKLKEKLRNLAKHPSEEKDVSLLAQERVTSEIAAFRIILSKFSWVPRLERLIEQADLDTKAGIVVLVIAILTVVGFLLGDRLHYGVLVSLIPALVMGYVPVFFLNVLRRKRIAAFETQLPEALDLIGRALRAGHAFSSGMKLAAESFKDPLGKEFTKTVGEINFGTSVADALKNLVSRVDCPDLKFFVVAVILQRETGGNLADIIESMARIIRERAAFEEKVIALTAEGRISAKIIAGIICFIVGFLYITNPAHFDPLLESPTGRIVALGASCSVFLGIYVMNRMTKSIKM